MTNTDPGALPEGFAPPELGSAFRFSREEDPRQSDGRTLRLQTTVASAVTSTFPLEGGAPDSESVTVALLHSARMLTGTLLEALADADLRPIVRGQDARVLTAAEWSIAAAALQAHASTNATVRDMLERHR